MKMHSLILVASLVFCGHEARAAAIPGCAQLDQLDNGEGDCEENAKFTKAGSTCLKGLESAIQKQTGKLKSDLADMAKKQAEGGPAQAGHLSSAGSDYATSQKTLQDLIDRAVATRAAIDGYLNKIYYPEDFDAPPEVIGDDPLKFLDDSPCYADNEKALKDQLAKTDGYIAQLRAAKDASALKGSTSTGRTTDLGNIVPSGPLKSEPKGPQAMPKAPKVRSSDISGTKEEKKK